MNPKCITDCRRAERIVQMAYDEHHVEGEVEINLEHDAHDSISEGTDNGCFVRAWVWVSFEGTDFDKGNSNE